jgi:hypothetical protein
MQVFFLIGCLAFLTWPRHANGVPLHSMRARPISSRWTGRFSDGLWNETWQGSPLFSGAYQLFGNAGATFRSEDAQVIATNAKAALREFVSGCGLTQPGAKVSGRVCGHERGESEGGTRRCRSRGQLERVGWKCPPESPGLAWRDRAEKLANNSIACASRDGMLRGSIRVSRNHESRTRPQGS